MRYAMIAFIVVYILRTTGTGVILQRVLLRVPKFTANLDQILESDLR